MSAEVNQLVMNLICFGTGIVCYQNKMYALATFYLFSVIASAVATFLI